METIYNVDYFIKKFEAIAEEFWITGTLTQTKNDKALHCSMGHCGVHHNIANMTEEAKFFVKLFDCLPKQDGFKSCLAPICINDGHHELYKQPSPKQRILAALYDIKAKQQPKEKVVYKTVVIDSAVKDLQETLTEN